jgi:NAD(P)-dependent dehydrogenase (short-subunit alcohol dehydrogenase family)
MSVALVTGTSSGFGRLTAERLVRLGWTVVGTVRDPARDSAPEGCETVALDMRDSASIASAAAGVFERHGRLDALVSNAGFGLLAPLEEITIAEFRDQLEVNLVGTLDLCLACLPGLRVAGGVIVQVSSVSGRMSDEGFGAYCASKFGLEAVSESLSLELAPQGVRVVIVEPGPFRTPIAKKMPSPPGRGSTGRYDAIWNDLDEFNEFITNDAEDPEIAVDAIVAAATVPGAPLRLPVGKKSDGWITEYMEADAADRARAVEFLAANAGIGRAIQAG